MDEETKSILQSLNKKKKELDFMIEIATIVSKLEDNQRALEQKYKDNDEIIIKNKENINKLKSIISKNTLNIL